MKRVVVFVGVFAAFALGAVSAPRPRRAAGRHGLTRSGLLRGRGTGPLEDRHRLPDGPRPRIAHLQADRRRANRALARQRRRRVRRRAPRNGRRRPPRRLPIRELEAAVVQLAAAAHPPPRQRPWLPNPGDPALPAGDPFERGVQPRARQALDIRRRLTTSLRRGDAVAPHDRRHRSDCREPLADRAHRRADAREPVVRPHARVPQARGGTPSTVSRHRWRTGTAARRTASTI